MANQITNSLEAWELHEEKRQVLYRAFRATRIPGRGRMMMLNQTPVTRQLNAILNNISDMIDQLNRTEVYARRAGKKSSYQRKCTNLVDEINQAFDTYDHMFFFAKLID